ncbi:MAG: RNA-directed polymerase (reverse transcriptase) [Acidimicrobiales bacterium]|nr:RNA-directed polymerase (reverse transcriptase) [Acidimicrobiales bacterium]
MPIVASPTKQDKVQTLQRTLYRAAKADPGRRFHALYDKVLRRDVLERAWEQVRRNRGAAGIDRTTIADVEEHGVTRLLDELAADLKAGTYRPLPARRVWIPKPGSSEQRPLSIPAVRDRIVQAAAKTVIEPIFEADFLPCSFGFRPKRRAHDALQVLIDEAWRGRRWMVETDVASCFEAIPHDRLMQAIEERIVDRHVLKLLRALLRAGVMEAGVVRGSVTGTPQGGVVSPLLCNVYLHRLDRAWPTKGMGVLVRYADDVVVMCRSRREAEDALSALTAILAELGLEPKAAKTRIVHLEEGGEGVDFLGFHHRWVRAESRRFRHVLFLARWPSDKAMQHARDRVRELTDRRRLWLPVEAIVEDVNLFLRGWSGYFRFGNSAHHLDKVRNYALMRLALVVAKRHHRSRAYGWSVVAFQSSNQLGLISLDGIVVAPRPNRPWRGRPNAGGERRR